MKYEFTTEDIKQAARVARIYSPDFSEEKFESLMELNRRVDESGYLETVQGVRRLEKEKGVSITRILDACEELLKENKQLESQGVELESRLKSLGELIRQAEQKYGQLQAANRKAEEALAETIAHQEKEAKQMRAFQRRAEAEKRRITEEVEDSHRKGNITREEVIAAGQLKAEVEKHGFTLEMALSVAGEFAGYGDASERLAAGLKKEGSLARYSKELEDWGNGRRVALLSEMSRLEEQNKQLEEEGLKLQTDLAQLRADEAVERERRQFYCRFSGLGGVLELLAKWKRVYPLRCNNPAYIITRAFDESAGCARIWTDKLFSNRCPQCGMNTLDFDAEVYEALGIPVGRPIKIALGVES